MSLADVSGSYCVLGTPETIESACISVVDTVSGLPSREDLFQRGLTKTAIDAGTWTTVFFRTPDDFTQYWENYGETAVPVLEATLTVECEGRGERVLQGTVVWQRTVQHFRLARPAERAPGADPV